jgi:hypothetical protein
VRTILPLRQIMVAGTPLYSMTTDIIVLAAWSLVNPRQHNTFLRVGLKNHINL